MWSCSMFLLMPNHIIFGGIVSFTSNSIVTNDNEVFLNYSVIHFTSTMEDKMEHLTLSKSRKDVMKNAFNDWLNETSLHGMKYFADSNILAKIIWVIEIKIQYQIFLLTLKNSFEGNCCHNKLCLCCFDDQ